MTRRAPGDARIYVLSRGALAFVWLYHGAVPKLLARHPDELRPLLDAGVGPANAYRMVTAAGWAEIALGLVTLLAWRARWPLWLSIGLMVIALVGVAATTPALLVAAFNPVTLNGLVVVVASIALLAKPRPGAASDDV